MEFLITSSVEKSIKDSAKLAQELGVGLEVSRFPQMQCIDSDFPAVIAEMQNAVKDFNGLITLHGLFSDLNPATKDAEIKKVVVKRFNQSFDAALAIGANHVVFHSGHKGMRHTVSMSKYIENSINFWSDFVKKFEDNNIVAVLENVIDFSPESLAEIVYEVNSPNLQICLDTGHANLSSELPISQWIQTYGEKLGHMHCHNNYRTNDDHAGLKYGTVNFLDVADTLKSENLNPYVVFEIFDKKELVESLNVFRKLMEEGKSKPSQR